MTTHQRQQQLAQENPTCDHCQRTADGRQSCCAFHFQTKNEAETKQRAVKATMTYIEMVAAKHGITL